MAIEGAPALIALDWGTTRLRAFLMEAGRVVHTRQADDAGVQRLSTAGAAAFEAAFDALTRDWRESRPDLPVVACGMVGSAQGWREVPYVPCPVDAATIAAASQTLHHDGTPIVIAPGALHAPPGGTPDVMRGEETQVVGALHRDPTWTGRCCIVLPGTHAKWVSVRVGRIVALRTAMTGEVYAVLRAHSILGRLMTASTDEPAPPGEGFVRGLDDAQREPDLLHALFAVRTLGLTGQLKGDHLADYLSGLLIGSELRAGLAQADPTAPLLLVGDDALCARYAAALAHARRPADAQLGNTAPDGLWALARQRGLVD